MKLNEYIKALLDIEAQHGGDVEIFVLCQLDELVSATSPEVSIVGDERPGVTVTKRGPHALFNERKAVVL